MRDFCSRGRIESRIQPFSRPVFRFINTAIVHSCRYYSRHRTEHCLFVRATGHHRTELGSCQEAETRGMGSSPSYPPDSLTGTKMNERVARSIYSGMNVVKMWRKTAAEWIFTNLPVRTFNYELVGGLFLLELQRWHVSTLGSRIFCVT